MGPGAQPPERFLTELLLYAKNIFHIIDLEVLTILTLGLTLS